MITLRGITWAHSRGYVPLVAASEAWQDVHGDVTIEWVKRSFWGFGEGPLEEVAREFDLIVFDHPHTGDAAHRRLFVPFDVAVGDCVGASLESYRFEGRLYGLPIDAACQSAAYRPDLIGTPPATWPEVIDLARRTGRVRCAFSPMGALGMLHSLTAGLGSPGGQNASLYFERAAGLEALDRLGALYCACGPAALDYSPVRILGDMARTDDVLYTPLLYCYSNYAREGFAPRRLHFTAPPGTGSTLGGAGLAVSAYSKHRDLAVRFANWLISEPCQSGLYLHALGQPALRAAWTSTQANEMTGGFFTALLPTIDRAYLRPNWPRFGKFQSCAAGVLHDHLKGVSTAPETLESIDRLYREIKCHD